MNLSEILAEGESGLVEFKEIASEKVAKEVTAFASSRGGFVIIGITDVDHTVVGLNEPFEMVRQKIQSWIHDFVRPAPQYAIGRIVHDGFEILVVTVEPGPEAAYAFQEQFYYRNNEQSQPIPATEVARRFSDARLARELLKLTEWVDHSLPAKNVAAGIMGQGELATLNYSDLLGRLARDLSAYFVARECDAKLPHRPT